MAFDPGGATASRVAIPHILPSTVPSVSASATFFLSWLNPPPHPITVYASHPPSPTTTQHSLPGGALQPYRGRSFTDRTTSASPDAPEPVVRTHLPPAVSQANFCMRRWLVRISMPVPAQRRRCGDAQSRDPAHRARTGRPVIRRNALQRADHARGDARRVSVHSHHGPK